MIKNHNENPLENKDLDLDYPALLRCESQVKAFEIALSSGRLHHAWLLCGPKGLGKATFANQAAYRLLGAKTGLGSGIVKALSDDPVARLILARSHPDFLLLSLENEENRGRKSLSIDEVRALPEFFSKAPAMGAYRIAVIDSVDDLNVNSANALLKILEEPPPRSILWLISHRPGLLLPTLKSRCRQLSFLPWSDADMMAFLKAKTGEEELTLKPLIAVAEGSPGLALAIRGGAGEKEAGEIKILIEDILEHLPKIHSDKVLCLSEYFRGQGGRGLFDRIILLIKAKLAVHATQAQALSLEQRARLAELWSKIQDISDDIALKNLDLIDGFWAILAECASVAKAVPFSSR